VHDAPPAKVPDTRRVSALLNLAKPSGPADVKTRVLDAGLCTVCGACVGHCPYLKTLGERVAYVHPCSLERGRCAAVCPRMSLAPAALDAQVFGVPRADAVLGVHRGIHFARAVNAATRQRGQYGGVVTALTAFAIRAGSVSAAVMTAGAPTDFPRPIVARDAGAVMAAAGTKYTACATLTPLAGLMREGETALGIVGRPCQVAAVRKIQSRAEGDGGIRLVIGLFCFWALSPDFYRFVRSREELNGAAKIDIPKDGGIVFSGAGRSVTVPLEEIRPFIRPACQSCFDPTAEFADLAVGSTEYDPGWNTLIVRSARAQVLVDAAVNAGVIELVPYPEERLPVLRAAVLAKKRRVVAMRDAGHGDTAYLQLTDAERDALAAAEA
jgi:coenzyme F420-reducing hydrogenase beta subunit